MSEDTVAWSWRQPGVAELRLIRAEARNSLNPALMAALSATLRELSGDPRVRIVVVTGEGKVFSGGGDLREMRSPGWDATVQVRGFAGLMAALDACDKPLVVRVNGHAIGGGAAIAAAGDVTIAASTARMGFGEVRLGVVPALAGPYAIRRIGEGRTRRLLLSGVQLSAEEACRLGLIDEVAAPDELDDAVDRVLDELLLGGPEAQRHIKRLLPFMRDPMDPQLVEALITGSVEAQSGDEAHEGIDAFLERRPPAWTQLPPT